MLADQPTKERIKNLAVVGNALYELASDVTQKSDYFFAKEALNKFLEGIKQLEDLDNESVRGMENLVNYLHGKIDRRMGLAE